jgi:peroxiredoxin Q/BCP
LKPAPRILATCWTLAICLELVACDASSSSTPGGDSITGKAEEGNVEEGELAPNVELILQTGKRVSLESMRGKHVVLYFYPEDETKGCTIEARGVRDAHADFGKAGAIVFGVSTQDEASHQAFIEAESLPFDLVVDADGAVARTFGAKLTLGRAARDTILIDEHGVIRKIWRGVSPSEHSQLVLDELAKW